jgi:hypothetical protein
MMDARARRRAQREFVSETLTEILYEIKQRLDAGEITDEEARAEVLAEGDKAIEALSATRRSQTGHR